MVPPKYNFEIIYYFLIHDFHEFHENSLELFFDLKFLTFTIFFFNLSQMHFYFHFFKFIKFLKEGEKYVSLIYRRCC